MKIRGKVRWEGLKRKQEGLKNKKKTTERKSRVMCGGGSQIFHEEGGVWVCKRGRGRRGFDEPYMCKKRASRYSQRLEVSTIRRKRKLEGRRTAIFNYHEEIHWKGNPFLYVCVVRSARQKQSPRMEGEGGRWTKKKKVEVLRPWYEKILGFSTE